jgi:hypothetical protein
MPAIMLYDDCTLQLEPHNKLCSSPAPQQNKFRIDLEAEVTFAELVGIPSRNYKVPRNCANLFAETRFRRRARQPPDADELF